MANWIQNSRLTPLEHYQQELQQKHIVFDASQQQAMNVLQQLYQQLGQQCLRPNAIQWLLKRALLKRSIFTAYCPYPLRGVYLWGGAGRGKTYMMDLFYHSLPFASKQRRHYLIFMHWIHDQLAHHQGQKDPLQQIAKEYANQFNVLCFDEFEVEDIGDAMLLGILLPALIRQNVVLVLTSNVPPEKLYSNGLQRSRFEPAITSLQTHCQVLNVDSGIDYRLLQGVEQNRYYFPLNSLSEQRLLTLFQQWTVQEQEQFTEIMINHRIINCRVSGRVIWLNFAELCEKAHSGQDFVTLAEQFDYCLISQIPILTDEKTDALKRFILLVDALYDAHVQTAFSAAVAIEQLCQNSTLAFAFKRTASRLIEMSNRTQ